jgi:hypothetical protein
VEVHFSDGSVMYVNDMIEEQFEIIKTPAIGNKQVAFVLFDPNSNILKQVSFPKSFDELAAQLQKAPYLLDRYDALVEMRKFPIDLKRAAILDIFQREKHEGIINEAISQLGSDNDTKTIDALKAISVFPKAAVRDHLLKCLDPNPSYKAIFEKGLIDSSYDVAKTALEKLCNYYPTEAKTYLDATQNVQGMFHSNRMKWLELSILHKVNELDARRELSFFASPNFEFRTRGQAFNCLKSTQTFNQDVVASLFQAMLSTNGRLAGPAAELANYFSANLEYKMAMRKYYQNQNYSLQEKEILSKNIFLLKN